MTYGYQDEVEMIELARKIATYYSRVYCVAKCQGNCVYLSGSYRASLLDSESIFAFEGLPKRHPLLNFIAAAIFLMAEKKHRFLEHAMDLAAASSWPEIATQAVHHQMLKANHGLSFDRRIDILKDDVFGSYCGAEANWKVAFLRDYYFARNLADCSLYAQRPWIIQHPSSPGVYAVLHWQNKHIEYVTADIINGKVEILGPKRFHVNTETFFQYLGVVNMPDEEPFDRTTQFCAMIEHSW